MPTSIGLSPLGLAVLKIGEGSASRSLTAESGPNSAGKFSRFAPVRVCPRQSLISFQSEKNPFATNISYLTLPDRRARCYGLGSGVFFRDVRRSLPLGMEVTSPFYGRILVPGGDPRRDKNNLQTGGTDGWVWIGK